MAAIDFLSADTPLVKVFTLQNGVVDKAPYPMVRDFFSHRVEVTGIQEFYTALSRAAAQGWCMSKGALNKELKGSSRAGTTNPNDATHLLVLDFDNLGGFVGADSARANNLHIDAALRACGLDTYTHVIQWSASAWLPSSSSTLSAHVFFWLNNPVNPALLKSWLVKLNLQYFRTSVSLTKTGASLHWPIDPSVADNSRIIYIAPPVLKGGLQPPSPAPTITYVEREQAALPSTLFTVNPQEIARDKQKLLSELRQAVGLRPIKDTQLKIQNGQLFMSKPGEATITGIKHERGFVYLNLNGGDSWGYYHPEDNAEFIYNFKGEPIYKTSELLPEYWASINKVDPSQPVGPVKYFVCRDFRTDRLYNGMYYVEEDRLEMARAANEGRLKSFLKQHGQPVQDFVPDFSIVYDPHDKRKFSLEDRFINTYVPSEFEALPRREQEVVPAMVKRVIESAVGKGEPYEHFLNWLADIVQFKEKIGTAWVLHGNEGTGKGVLFHHIITPILGKENVASITMRALDSTFNGFMERALAVFVDEVQISALKGSLGISASLRNFITEKTASIRRMYSEPYNCRSYANFIFASNMPDPVVVPPTDRRFHVGAFQAEKLVLSEQEIAILGNQVEDFYMYLAGRTVDRSRSKEILESEDRERLMKLSQTAADTMAEVLLDGDIEDLVVNLPQHGMLPSEAAYIALVKSILEKGKQESQLTRDEILTIFQYRVGKEVPDSPNKFTSFLKHHRIYTKRIRADNRIMYGISVNWNKDEKWMQEALLSLAAPASQASSTNVTPIKKAKLQ